MLLELIMLQKARTNNFKKREGQKQTYTHTKKTLTIWLFILLYAS